MASKRPWLRYFLIALAVRSSTLFSQTFFQPDEFFQALEPAYHLVYGYGELTWEWRDLPSLATSDLLRLPRWQRLLLDWSGSRLRGWLWPTLFASVYWVLKVTELDSTRLIVFAPRLLLVLLAAGTDVLTARLSRRLFPHPLAAQLGFFLSLTSLFNYHALPRALSTSFETLLAALALVTWPLPGVQGRSHLAAALVAAASCVMVRPTSAVFWLPLGGMLVVREIRTAGHTAGLRVIGLASLIGSAVLAASTSLDYFLSGTWSMPLLAFFSQNLILKISTFYGTSPWHYHLTQSLPILLTTALPFAVGGIRATLRAAPMPTSQDAQRPNAAALRELLIAALAAVVVFSVISHKEWRFLHFVLPVLLQFAAQDLLQRSSMTGPGKANSNGTGLSRWIILYLVFVPMGPAIYLSHFHGRAQIGITEQLRFKSGDYGNNVAVLMPCYSIPGMSHIHRRDLRDGALWSLGCEPPVGIIGRAAHRPEALQFFGNATHSLEAVLSGRWRSPYGLRPTPDQVICFGDLLRDGRDAQLRQYYHQTWYGWNGFDLLQDEAERRGGVFLWTRRELL